MTEIKIKRAYDDAEPSDGYRILVDRLWPRGVSKERLQMDYWAKDIAPSDELRHWFHADMKGRRRQFDERYMRELAANPAMPEFAALVRSKKTVTLVYATKDPLGAQAEIIKEYLEVEEPSRQRVSHEMNA